MDLSNNPTRRELAELLAVCDDEATHHVVWVSNSGRVSITPLVPGMASIDVRRRPDFRFQYETLIAGNGYTGPAAAQDDEWVDRLLKALVRDWREGLRGYSDDWDIR